MQLGTTKPHQIADCVSWMTASRTTTEQSARTTDLLNCRQDQVDFFYSAFVREVSRSGLAKEASYSLQNRLTPIPRMREHAEMQNRISLFAH